MGFFTADPPTAETAYRRNRAHPKPHTPWGDCNYRVSDTTSPSWGGGCRGIRLRSEVGWPLWCPQKRPHSPSGQSGVLLRRHSLHERDIRCRKRYLGQSGMDRLQDRRLAFAVGACGDGPCGWQQEGRLGSLQKGKFLGEGPDMGQCLHLAEGSVDRHVYGMAT